MSYLYRMEKSIHSECVNKKSGGDSRVSPTLTRGVTAPDDARIHTLTRGVTAPDDARIHTLTRGVTILLALLVLPVCLHAQLDSFNPLMQKDGKSGEAAASVLGRETAPVARTVEPELYVCGANDLMSLVITMPVNVEAVLPVSADGSLVIPKVGAIPIGGKTLAEARRDVTDVLKRKYPAFEGTLTLLQPRPILVKIRGEVKTPGLLRVTAGTPVSMALQMAAVEQEPESTTKMQLMQQGDGVSNPNYRQRLGARYFGSWETERRALRRIVIQHADGSTSRADIPMYEATRDGRYDPLLREGDIIIVPQRDVSTPTIAVLGAVQRPGVFEYMRGDRLSDLLRMGFGLDPTKTVTGAELTREGKESIDIPVSTLGGEGVNDMELEPGDRLIVYARRQSGNLGTAVVDGEVEQPGAYPIVPGETRLSELVKMAGGFTSQAWPGLSELYRRQIGIEGVAPDPSREKDRTFEKSPLVNEDTLYWSMNARLREGQVAVNFHRLFVAKQAAADVPLEDGDVLLVPRNTRTVYVYGQVNTHGFVPWSEGKDFEWYIAQAGGIGESADEDRAAVIKSNTRAWVNPEDAVIEPGDMIYVPHEPLVPVASTTELLAVVAAIAGSLAGVAGLVISILNTR